jgi:hypothetical protein
MPYTSWLKITEKQGRKLRTTQTYTMKTIAHYDDLEQGATHTSNNKCTAAILDVQAQSVGLCAVRKASN